MSTLHHNFYLYFYDNRTQIMNVSSTPNESDSLNEIKNAVGLLNIACLALGVPANALMFVMTLYLEYSTSGVTWMQGLAIMEGLYCLEYLRYSLSFRYCEYKYTNNSSNYIN